MNCSMGELRERKQHHGVLKGQLCDCCPHGEANVGHRVHFEATLLKVMPQCSGGSVARSGRE
jgi:hypothetical protein